MTPELTLQKAIRERLISSAGVVALVPADNILDRNQRPNPDPSIILGEGQSVDDGDSISRSLTRVYMDLHLWKKEPSTQGVKALAGAIRSAINGGRLKFDPGFHCVDCRVSSMRFLRDPDGKTSHGVVTVEARVQEL